MNTPPLTDFGMCSITVAHDHDFNTAWIELQLAHVDKNSILGTYNHAQYLDGRREIMQWYADYLDKLEMGVSILPHTGGE